MKNVTPLEIAELRMLAEHDGDRSVVALCDRAIKWPPGDGEEQPYFSDDVAARAACAELVAGGALDRPSLEKGRIPVTLGTAALARLQRLATRKGKTKSEVASELLEAALTDDA